jgi:hypothetical protein
MYSQMTDCDMLTVSLLLLTANCVLPDDDTESRQNVRRFYLFPSCNLSLGERSVEMLRRSTFRVCRLFPRKLLESPEEAAFSTSVPLNTSNYIYLPRALYVSSILTLTSEIEVHWPRRALLIRY